MKTAVIVVKPGNEVKVPIGRILKAKLISDGCCELTIEEENICRTPKDDPFVLVEASKLSLEDDFLKYEPQTGKQQDLKEKLAFAIKSGVKDFYRPIYDPSIDENGNIVFVAGKMPAGGYSYNWWKNAAKKYMSDRKIRLGTKNEYVAFFGAQIKKLIACGWSIEDSWESACSFFSFASTYKILEWDDEAGGFWMASHFLYLCNNRNFDYDDSVGWYVSDVSNRINKNLPV